MITRLVKMTFRPEATEEFIQIFMESKDRIRAFDGCRHVELLRDKIDSQVFFTLSLWETQDNLDNYRNSELFNTTWAKTKLLFADKPEAWSTNRIAVGS